MSESKENKEIENTCIKCGRDISSHPSTGRFHTIILHDNECAWNPDIEFRGFVINTLKNSGYSPEDFGH